MTDAEHDTLQEAMDKQAEELREALAEDLGGDPEDYNVDRVDGAHHGGEIRLWQEDDWWIAKDVETGVTTQGKSRATALENLDDGVALCGGERGRVPTDEELQAAEIGSADNTTGDQEPPDILE